MRKDRIYLFSRYGDTNYLEEVASDVYKLVTEGNYRIGYNSTENIIQFVDPVGGPFISAGTVVRDKIVTFITLNKDNGNLLVFTQPISEKNDLLSNS